MNVLITGCARGLGWELARFFVSRGDRVFGCTATDAGVARLVEAFGKPHRFARVDVSSWEEVSAWSNGFEESPDLLLNNAAVIAPVAPLWELDPEQTSRVIDVNVNGTIHVLRAFLPRMVSAGSGVVVNFSSGWGRSTSPGVASYCASKYAVEGLTAALAQELPPGLAAVSLNPGVIATDMLRECFGESAAAYPSAAEWIRSAGPFLAGLGASDNGSALTVPGVPLD